MKRMKLVGLFSTVLTLALLATVSWADEPEGEPVLTSPPEDIPGLVLVGVSQQFAPTLNGAFSGAGTLTVNGVAMPVTIISEPLVLADGLDNYGRLVGTKTTLIDFGNGDTLTTVDEVFLTPTEPGWYSVQATMTVTGGTGVFANATGVIDTTGIIQTDGESAQALWLMEGRILS